MQDGARQCIVPVSFLYGMAFALPSFGAIHKQLGSIADAALTRMVSNHRL